MLRQISNFINQLSREVVSKETTNLYAGRSKASQIRKENLRLYLNKMFQIKPKILLLGEAPGYRGCGVTGVPFTSERILTKNMFFMDLGFTTIHQDPFLESEISATIVWNELKNYPDKPLIWNIFPFHPHKIDHKGVNRTPNKDELETGAKYLKKLLTIFSIDKIIALGRKPESKIKDLDFDYSYVRHPANGGKNKFVLGMRDVLKYQILSGIDK